MHGGGCRRSGEVNQRNVVVDEKSWSRPDDGVRGHGWAAAGLVSDQSREEEELAHRALCSIYPGFARRAIPGGKVRNERIAAAREKIVSRWDPARRGSSSSLSVRDPRETRIQDKRGHDTSQISLQQFSL